MGVGELSAINGVAGAYTENVKLIHIVGTTGTKAQKARAMIHHSLGPDPDHRVLSLVLLQPEVSTDLLLRYMQRYQNLLEPHIAGLTTPRPPLLK